MAAKDRGLSKVTAEYKHKNTKKIEFLKNNITEDYSKEMYNGKIFNLLVPFPRKVF